MQHVAIVTGGASGIGKAVVEEYHRRGIAVIIADVQDELGQELSAALSGQGGKVMYVRCDVTSPEDQQHVVDVAMKTYGRLDIAVNNAGIGGEANPTGSYSLDGWHQVINVNLNGAFLGMRSQIPSMIATGGGSIVNVSSILGAVGFSGAPAYVTAKHGLVGLTKAAALDHALQGIRVNAVGLGFIETPLIAGIIEDPTQRDYLTSLHPMGRLGRPEEVADLICFLTSEKATFITGSYFPVDGGYLAR
ncbi:MAG TPA: SDR family NAD(P)-dependent oxidoreductase [Candidatus Didemnitutus sp.]|nr:SDR family NAD(P)-dependent oxidoreductase [Candidatus Didemnitutus sp.]